MLEASAISCPHYTLISLRSQEVWHFNVTTFLWRLISVAGTAPRCRAGHVAAAHHQYLIIQGGYTVYNSAAGGDQKYQCLSDTWSFQEDGTGGYWTKLSEGTPLSRRWAGRMPEVDYAILHVHICGVYMLIHLPWPIFATMH